MSSEHATDIYRCVSKTEPALVDEGKADWAQRQALTQRSSVREKSSVANHDVF